VKLGLLVAIDMTQSNRPPVNGASLHRYEEEGGNAYEQCVEEVATVMHRYLDNGLIAPYGFGSKLPPSSYTSHCFSLKGCYFSPMVRGAQGVLQAYRHALKHTWFSGPTLLRHIVSIAGSWAATEQHTEKYWVLLILTDGDLSDWDLTKEEIQKTVDLPLSITIVCTDHGGMKSGDGLDAKIIEMRQASDRVSLHRHPSRGPNIAADVLNSLPGTPPRRYTTNPSHKSVSPRASFR